MMIKVACLGIGAVLIASIFNDKKKEYGIFIGLATSTIIAVVSLTNLSALIKTIRQINEYLEGYDRYINIQLRLIGIAYISELAQSICKEGGYGTVALQIDMSAKIIILLNSLPIIITILQMVGSFLGI